MFHVGCKAPAERNRHDTPCPPSERCKNTERELAPVAQSRIDLRESSPNAKLIDVPQLVAATSLLLESSSSFWQAAHYLARPWNPWSFGGSGSPAQAELRLCHQSMYGVNRNVSNRWVHQPVVAVNLLAEPRIKLS